MTILAIESSCDETSVAILQNEKVIVNLIFTQYLHSKFGGVVPELASRAHLLKISELTNEALLQSKLNISDINAIAVTNKPGLAGSLIVGSNFAKGLGLRYNLPVIPINHIEGHIYSGHIDKKTNKFPFISLVASGGHTAIFDVIDFQNYELIGTTIDDAAGEAFDKIAKMIGLEYPGGPLIDKHAQEGNPKAFRFPRPLIHEDNYDFSFSGLKTSVRYFVEKELNGNVPEDVFNDFCASVQDAITDVLVLKAMKAAKKLNYELIVVSGGVSANKGLRNKFKEFEKKESIQVLMPELDYCIDNAAMIGFVAYNKIKDLNNLDIYKKYDFLVSSSAIRNHSRLNLKK
ncbi:MAG: tRNA (adenosine(37)-N6)-threonylcarbamoyltransferase complex transferase subunit TsaD [Candidatus Kapabacteria bacterium]|nr:tRNA (adenosine(37)-N6)-threonylcarbamoyltransferase complex transferase subunit TsaD [Candidatus Kapabacteria bacterium]